MRQSLLKHSVVALCAIQGLQCSTAQTTLRETLTTTAANGTTASISTTVGAATTTDVSATTTPTTPAIAATTTTAKGAGPKSTTTTTTTTQFVFPASCVVDHSDWVGDSYCDSDHGSYNTASCDWDGGDCCPDTCRKNTNLDFSCGKPEYSCRDPESAHVEECPLRSSDFWGDGFCDEWNNALAAEEGATYVNLNSRACGWDGGDCCRLTCQQPLEKGGGSCTHTMENCLDPAAPDSCNQTLTPLCDPFEGCTASFPSYIGDGWCDDDEHNVGACGWDGGDCCESTCILWHRPGTNDCGVQSSYACLDPSAVEYTGRPVTAHPRSTTTQAGVDTTTTQAGVDTTTTQADSVPTSTTTAGQEAPTTTTQDPVQITDDFSQNAGQPGTPDNSALDDTTVLGIAVGAVAAVVIVGVAVGIAVAVKKSQNQRKNSTYDGSIGSPFVRSHTASMKAEASSTYETLDEPGFGGDSMQGVNI